MSGRQLDPRFCFLIFQFPLISVYKHCFIVPRSEIDLIGFTVTWNKAIGKELKACWDFRAQNQLAGAHLTAELLLVRLKWLPLSPAHLAPQGREALGSVVGESQGKVANQNAEEGTRFRRMGNSKNLNLMLMGL